MIYYLTYDIFLDIINLMTKAKFEDFDQYINEQLKEPRFKKLSVEHKERYQLARVIIKARFDKKLSQRELAIRAKTTQAVISRVENMTVDSSVRLIQKIAAALDSFLEIKFVWQISPSSTTLQIFNKLVWFRPG